MKKVLFLIAFVSFSLICIAQTRSVATGNWNNGLSWDAGVVPPDNGDSIFVEVGDVITLSANVTHTVPVIIVVRGTLVLKHTMTLASSSKVIIETGGVVTSTNNGNRLHIGAVTWGGFKATPRPGFEILTDLVLSNRKLELNAQTLMNDVMEFSLNLVGFESFSDFEFRIESSEDGVEFELFDNVEVLNSVEKFTFNVTDVKGSYIRVSVVIDGVELNSNIIDLRESRNSEVSFYPNPFKDQLNVGNWSDDLNSTVRIFNSVGHMVFQSCLSRILDLSMLDSGMYTIHKVSEEGSVSSHRVLKN